MNHRIPIWFDIDGTLLRSRMGRWAFRDALEEHYGWSEGIEDVRFAGATDLQVLHDLALHNGVCPEATRQAADGFFERMSRHLHRHLAREKPSLIFGAKELLQVLAEEAPVLLGLVTGNARHCAYAKLEHADLDKFFAFGGFGCQHPDRNQLAHLARREAAARCEAGESLSTGLIVGDTPNDVKAAKSIGAISLGVASEHFSSDDLQKVGADLVVEDLQPTPELRDWMLDQGSRSMRSR